MRRHVEVVWPPAHLSQGMAGAWRPAEGAPRAEAVPPPGDGEAWLPAGPYLLELRPSGGNPPEGTAGYAHGVVFTYDDSRILEASGAALAAGIAACMLALPPGFSAAASLFLAAPLLVCAAGIIAKRARQRAGRAPQGGGAPAMDPQGDPA